MNPKKIITQIKAGIETQARGLGVFAKQIFNTPVKEPALPPGSLVYIGEERHDEIRIRAIRYTETTHEELELEKPEDAFVFRDAEHKTWIDISGVHEVSVIEKIGTHFGVHPLVLEDIVHTRQRPKLEDYESYLYLVAKMLRFNEKVGRIEIEQVSFILTKNCVLTFQEKEGDVFQPVRARAKNAKGRIRKFGPDYLTYALVDAIVDHYFKVLDKIGEQIEVLEDEVNAQPDPQNLRDIHRLKREMILMRKSIWPLREVINQMGKDEYSLIKKTTRVYLRDVYDHTIQIIENADSFRDMLSGLQDLYLSAMSNRMNEVMKVLTIIATIFIPPTFVAGVYGMNFENMPELHAPWGYFIALAVMLACIIGMIIYFKRKNWF